jgi:hypothetical protein
MFDWIVVGVLYISGIAFFRLIGGLGAAGDAFRKWGGAYAERQRARNRLPSIPPSARRHRDDRR